MTCLADCISHVGLYFLCRLISHCNYPHISGRLRADWAFDALFHDLIEVHMITIQRHVLLHYHCTTPLIVITVITIIYCTHVTVILITALTAVVHLSSDPQFGGQVCECHSKVSPKFPNYSLLDSNSIDQVSREKGVFSACMFENGQRQRWLKYWKVVEVTNYTTV